MNNIDLKTILEKHKMWLNDEDGGEMADLCWADLSGADISGADMRWADMSGANMSGAVMKGTDMRGAVMRWADISGADMSGADISGADMREADISGANMSGADISGANMNGVQHIESARNLFYPLTCPEKGEYTAFKKADEKIVELRIPADAKRLSATGRKCRANKAVVISITTLEGDPAGNEVRSDYDSSFAYRIGETVEVQNFDENRWNECAPGIHHYITREEAVRH